MIREAAPQSPFLPARIWMVPLGAAVLFYKAFRLGPGEASQQIVWYSVLIVAGALALTWACRAQKEFDLFEPLYMVFAFFAVSYPVRALFAVWLDESWLDPAKTAIWKSLSASALGFACFAIGYRFVAKKFDFRQRTWSQRGWNLTRANTVGLLFFAIGLCGFAAMRLLGGSFLYFISLDSDIKAPEAMTAWFFYILWVCVFLQVGALIQLGSWFSSGSRTLWTILYCILALFSTFLLSRYVTVLFLMMLLLSWHYRRKRIRPIQAVFLLVLVLAYLGLAGLYREWVSPVSNLDEVAGLAELAGQQSELVVRYVIRDLEQLSNLSEVISMTPSAIPYQHGSTFTPVFFKPIPRALMPEKPLGASALFSRSLIPDSYDIGLVTGLGGWGEWYLNFSWPGLILGMGLTGALTGAAYRAMWVAGEFNGVLLYLSCVVALLTWLRNDFNSASTFCLYYFIPSILALTYIMNVKTATSSDALVQTGA